MFEGCYNPVDGRLRLKFAAPVGTNATAGVAAGNDFAYASLSAPNRFVNGAPVDFPSGAVCVQAAATVSFDQGMPYTAAGTYAYTTSLPTSFHNGVGFVGNQISVEVLP